MPEMTPVQSSNIAAVGYDENDQSFPLVVEFLSGSVYAYPGSPLDAQALISAPSAGQYFAANIKRRPFRRIA